MPAKFPPGVVISIVAEKVDCGKPRCKRCSEGPGHGPYYYGYYKNPRRPAQTVKRYIGKELPVQLDNHQAH